MENKELEKFKTKELFDELKRREGVSAVNVPMDKTTTIETEGPETVLIVVD